MPSTYKKDKPWDTDDIDKWNVRYKDKKRGILSISKVFHLLT